MVQACTKSLSKAYKKRISEFPILSVLKSLLCELVVFVDMNTYILPTGRNFKTFFKDNYVNALDSYYFSLKKCLSITLIVLMEFT